MTEDEQRRARLKQSIMDTITNPGQRSAQASIGPSEIASPCDYCVGRALCRKYPEYWWEATPYRGDHSHKAWIGTAIHEKLDRDHPHGEHEERLFIHHLEGYGDIYGHSDLYQEDTSVDYKTRDLNVIDEIRLDGPKSSEVYQIFMYAYGQELAGRDVKDVMVVYIPRDTNDPDEVEFVVAPYDRRVALKALARLEEIWDKVRNHRGNELQRDTENCYPCSRIPKKKERWW